MKLYKDDYIFLSCILIGMFGLAFYDVRQTMDFLVYIADLFFELKIMFIITSTVGIFGFIFFIVHRIVHFGK